MPRAAVAAVATAVVALPARLVATEPQEVWPPVPVAAAVAVPVMQGVATAATAALTAAAVPAQMPRAQVTPVAPVAQDI